MSVSVPACEIRGNRNAGQVLGVREVQGTHPRRSHYGLRRLASGGSDLANRRHPVREKEERGVAIAPHVIRVGTGSFVRPGGRRCTPRRACATCRACGLHGDDPTILDENVHVLEAVHPRVHDREVAEGEVAPLRYGKARRLGIREDVRKGEARLLVQILEAGRPTHCREPTGSPETSPPCERSPLPRGCTMRGGADGTRTRNFRRDRPVL